MQRILLYRNGDTAPEVVRYVGNYSEWFGRVVQRRATLHLHIAAEQPRPDVAGVDAVVLTGSPLSVIERRSLRLTDDAERQGRVAVGAAQALLSRAADTPEAEGVLLNFLVHFAARA